MHCVSKEPDLCSYHVLKKWLQISEKEAPVVVIDREHRKPVFYKVIGGKAKPLTLQDVSFISKMAMVRAGVPSEFTPQSLRSAASSAAVDDGVPLERILYQGRWATKEMFKKYYYRPSGRKKKARKLNLHERLRE